MGEMPGDLGFALKFFGREREKGMKGGRKTGSDEVITAKCWIWVMGTRHSYTVLATSAYT